MSNQFLFNFRRIASRMSCFNVWMVWWCSWGRAVINMIFIISNYDGKYIIICVCVACFSLFVALSGGFLVDDGEFLRAMPGSRQESQWTLTVKISTKEDYAKWQMIISRKQEYKLLSWNKTWYEVIIIVSSQLCTLDVLTKLARVVWKEEGDTMRQLRHSSYWEDE